MLNNFIDQTFLINLLERTDRLEESKLVLQKASIVYRVWRAIKKKEGAKGLRKTMEALLSHCLTMNYQRVLVLEDDIKFINSNDEPLADVHVDQIPSDFDLYYLGCTLLGFPEKVSDNVIRLRAAYSSHAIVYSRKAMETILDHIDEDLPYDLILNKHIVSHGNSYCNFPMIATQRISVSDIACMDDYKTNPQAQGFIDVEKGTIDWGKFMEERFINFTKNI